MVSILDLEDAPFRICRFVAYGKNLPRRVVRLALALALRKEADLHHPGRASTGWVWPKDHVLGAAERVFLASPQYKRLVQMGLALEANVTGIPSAIKLRFMADQWDASWGAVESVVASLNMVTFTASVDRLVATRKKRKARKRVDLDPAQRRYLLLLDTLRRGVRRGDEVPALLDMPKGSTT